MEKVKSKGEETFALHIRAERLPEPVREYRFHPVRRWRFDFAWPELMISVECEGGIHSNGRHNRAKGFEQDAEKYNEATKLGWRVYRFSTGQIVRGEAIRFMADVIRACNC